MVPVFGSIARHPVTMLASAGVGAGVGATVGPVISQLAETDPLTTTVVSAITGLVLGSIIGTGIAMEQEATSLRVIGTLSSYQAAAAGMSREGLIKLVME